MRGEEVVKLLIKWLCKTADGGGFTKWWIPQQYFCYINILLIFSMPQELARRWLLSWCAGVQVCSVAWPQIPNDSNLEGTAAPPRRVDTGVCSMNWAGRGTVHLTADTWRQNALFFVFFGWATVFDLFSWWLECQGELALY